MSKFRSATTASSIIKNVVIGCGFSANTITLIACLIIFMFDVITSMLIETLIYQNISLLCSENRSGQVPITSKSTAECWT